MHGAGCGSLNPSIHLLPVPGGVGEGGEGELDSSNLQGFVQNKSYSEIVTCRIQKSQTTTKIADVNTKKPRMACPKRNWMHIGVHKVTHTGCPHTQNKHTLNAPLLCSWHCVSSAVNSLYHSLLFFRHLFICQPPTLCYAAPSPPFGAVSVSPISLSLSHQEVKVACALASALHSPRPTRSGSMNDRTLLRG